MKGVNILTRPNSAIQMCQHSFYQTSHFTSSGKAGVISVPRGLSNKSYFKHCIVADTQSYIPHHCCFVTLRVATEVKATRELQNTLLSSRRVQIISQCAYADIWLVSYLLTHLNREKIESKLSVPEIRGYCENALRASK